MNERHSLEDIRRRVRANEPKNWWKLSGTQRKAVLSGAWEECAWIATLTDERLMSAVYARMPLEPL